jgi:2-polyprenyl-3-methyl-5-hydroxy-6-metoxy-1,4-benzoquinol methylase
MAEHVCPVWVGYLLASPVRKLLQNPARILKTYVNEAMTVADIGCAMGFFSLPLARMVGGGGKVICVDVQEKMIKTLEKRARKAGLFDRIVTRICRGDSLGLGEFKGQIDFVLASAVVHEVPDVDGFFYQIYEAMKSGSKFFVIEPKMHVPEKDFEKTISIARKNGFEIIDRPEIRSGRTVLLQKANSE